MAAEDMLKIAGDLIKTSREEARNRFRVLNDAADAKNEELVDFSGTVLVENIPPVIDDAKVAVAQPEAAPSPIVTLDVDNVVDEKIKNKENAARRLAEKEKKGVQEKIESEKIAEIEKKVNVQPEKLKDPLEEALIEARQRYARTEFREQKAMENLEKHSKFNLSKIGKKYPENATIKSEREAYEKLLKTKLDKEIFELQSKSDKGEIDEKKLQVELKELYTYYNVKAAHDLYNARTEEIIAYKKEDSADKSGARKVWDNVSLKMTSVANWYNKEVPFWVKGGLAVGSFVAGAGAFSTGKRVWGSLIMATTGGMQLDAAAQFVDKYFSNKDGKKNIEDVTVESGKIDFEKFKGILNGEIENVDKKLDKYVLRSKVNKVVAVGMVAIFGTMAFSGIAHALQGSGVGAEHIATNVPNAKDVGAKLPPIPKSGVFSGGITENVSNLNPQDGETPITAAFEHPKSVPANFVEHGKMPVTHVPANFQEALHTQAPAESLTIEKGSSIEKTLIDHIRKIHPDMKNPGAAAHRMWLDYMHDNKQDLIKKVGETEYYKMLKDGMVNVKPGTTMIIDEHNPLKFELKDISGKISHLDGHHSVGGTAVEGGQGAGAGVGPTDIPKPSAAAVVGNADVLGHTGDTEQNISTAKEMFKSANAEYVQAADAAVNHPAGGDGPSVSQYEDMGRADEARKSAALTVENLANAKETCFKDIKAATNSIYKVTGYKWDDIKNLDYSSAYADDKLRPLMKEMAKEYKKEFGNTSNFPNSNTTFGKWLYRVKEVTIKKRLGINIE